MAIHADNDSALAQRANLNIAAAVVASFGAGASDSLIGRVTDDVRASHSVTELASAGGMSVVLGAVETAIARNTEAARPFNVTDSRAAQLAAHGGPHGGHWHHEGAAFGRYGLLGLGRGSREAANEGGDGASGQGGGTSRSSGSYAAMSGTGSEPAGAAFWGTAKGMMLTRSYANDNGMNWAPPDLMQMGRPALQALKESGLKGDGYKALRDPSGLHLDNPTIVAGARGYMKRNGVNHNEAAKASAAVDKLNMPADMRARHSAAVKGIHTATPENEAQRKEDLRKSGDEIIKHDPAHKAAVERERRGYKVDQGNAPRAENAAQGKEAAAAGAGATAKKDAAKTEQKDVVADAKDAKNDDTSARMAELLKKRQAAASAPKPNG